MKKVLALVLVALLILGVATVHASKTRRNSGISQTAGTGDYLGQGGLPSDANKIFRMVRFVPANADSKAHYYLSDDSVVIWDTASYDDGVTVTAGALTYDSRVAGVVINGVNWQVSYDYGSDAANNIGDANWTWLQTYGPNDTLLVGKVTVGEIVAASSATYNNGFCRYPSTTNEGRSSAQKGIMGFALDTSTGSTATTSKAEIFIMLN